MNQIKTLKDLRDLVKSLNQYDDNMQIDFGNIFQTFNISKDYTSDDNNIIEIECELKGSIGR